jgi:hypothetical protein
MFIKCGGSWRLEIDNNHLNKVIVILGDLCKCLSLKEQKYWRSYNIPPDGHISKTAFLRWKEVQFVDPEISDLLFKNRFSHFQEDWLNKFGWSLFKDLKNEDSHYLKTLRIPLIEDQKEFDEQVLSLVKVLIDSINEKEIGKEIEKIEKEQGISKLDRYLRKKEFRECDKVIEFLRNLQDLKDGVSHRKGTKYKRGATYFKLETNGFVGTFDAILKQGILLLGDLRSYFLVKT